MPRRIGRRAWLGAVAAGGLASVAGCTGGNTPVDGRVRQQGDLALTSPAFADGGEIPVAYTRDGANRNPPLSAEAVPDDAASLVVVVDDPDADRTFDHWLAWDVPPEVGTIPEGWDPPESVTQGRNGFGNRRYDGPDPPDGEEHTYRFKLFAVERRLELPGSASKSRIGDEIDGDILARTQLTGSYG